MEKMKIEIWSDIACPYCYIGKRKLENALQQFPQRGKIALIWHSYELNPSLPKAALGKSYTEYMADMQQQSLEETTTKLDELKALAQSVGLSYNFDKLIVTNTSDALQTCKLAQKYRLANNMEEAFFNAYFVEGKNISDRTVLLNLAQKAGLPIPELISVLDEKKYLGEIAGDIRYSEDVLNLEFIPFYLFNNKTIIQGSVADEVYLETLQQSFDDWQKNGISTQIDNSFLGKACSIDGKCS